MATSEGWVVTRSCPMGSGTSSYALRRDAGSTNDARGTRSNAARTRGSWMPMHRSTSTRSDGAAGRGLIQLTAARSRERDFASVYVRGARHTKCIFRMRAGLNVKRLGNDDDAPCGNGPFVTSGVQFAQPPPEQRPDE